MSDNASRYTHRIGTSSLHHDNPPKFYVSGDLQRAKCNFASVYAVTDSDAKAISQTGTVTGFKGTVWSQRLWVDFDQREASDRAQTYLKEQGYDFAVYTTGNRGTHIGIDRSAEPSHLLPQADKNWVRTNLPGADLSLYWHLHLIRLPGAIHEQTGKPKSLLYRSPGRSISLPSMSESGQRDSEDATETRQGEHRGSAFSVWSVASLLTGTGLEGRHKHLVMLSARLREDAKVSYDEALWVVQEVNRGFEEPKANEEVERIVKWAYESL